MAQFSSANVGFLMLGGYSLLGTVTTISDNVEAILQETTVLGDTWSKFTSVGVKKGALTQSGFFDDATGQIHDALKGTNIGSTRVFVYNLEGNTIGTSFVGFSGAVEAKYERGVALEKLHTATAGYSPSGPIEDGQVLKTHAAVVAAGDTKATSVDNALVPKTVFPITSNSLANPTVVTTPVNHGLVNNDVIFITGSNSTPSIAGQQIVTVTGLKTFTVPVNVSSAGTGGTFVKANTSNGGAAYVSCSALTLGGYTNLLVKVQHSADNSTFADLVTMTAITAAPAAERKEVAAATLVNRYLAASWAFTGAGSGQSATVFVGFSRA